MEHTVNFYVVFVGMIENDLTGKRVNVIKKFRRNKWHDPDEWEAYKTLYPNHKIFDTHEEALDYQAKLNEMTNNQLYIKIDEEMRNHDDIPQAPQKKITLPEMHLRRLDEITRTLGIASDRMDNIQKVLFDNQPEPKDPNSGALKPSPQNTHFFLHLEQAIANLGEVAESVRRKVMKLDEQLS